MFHLCAQQVHVVKYLTDNSSIGEVVCSFAAELKVSAGVQRVLSFGYAPSGAGRPHAALLSCVPLESHPGSPPAGFLLTVSSRLLSFVCVS